MSQGKWAAIVLVVVVGLVALGIVRQRDGNVSLTQAPEPTAIPTALPPPAEFPSDEPEFSARDIPDFGKRVLAGFNADRTSKGLPLLCWNDNLAAASQAHTDDMAIHNFVGHTGSDNSSPWDRIRKALYTGSLGGEVVAAGQVTPEEVVKAWTDSVEHHRIFTGSYGNTGVGYTNRPGSMYVNYWTADFGGSPGQCGNSNPVPIVTATPTQPGFPQFPTPVPFFTQTPAVPVPPTRTPIVQQQPTPTPVIGIGNGWIITLVCNSNMVCSVQVTKRQESQN